MAPSWTCGQKDLEGSVRLPVLLESYHCKSSGTIAREAWQVLDRLFCSTALLQKQPGKSKIPEFDLSILLPWPVSFLYAFLSDVWYFCTLWPVNYLQSTTSKTATIESVIYRTSYRRVHYERFDSIVIFSGFHLTQVCILPFCKIERGNGGTNTYSIGITAMISCFCAFSDTICPWL